MTCLLEQLELDIEKALKKHKFKDGEKMALINAQTVISNKLNQRKIEIPTANEGIRRAEKTISGPWSVYRLGL